MDDDLNEMTLPEPATPLDGGRSAAILLMLLEDDDSSAVLQHLDPAEVKSLAKGMFEASCATETDVESALEVFVSNNRDLSQLAVGAPVRIRGMMNMALGDSKANRIWTQIAPAQAAPPSLEALQWLDTATVSSLVANEHPQLAAIILSALPAQVAADAVAGLDEAVQADLLFRTATLGPVTAAAISDIEAILANYAESSARNPLIKLGGHGDVAKIVNNLARPQAAQLLKTIRKKDKILADAIEAGMFIFADLAQLNTKSLGAVIRNVEADRLALAIKGADAALSEKILSKLSVRKAQSISKEITEMGTVSRADVEEAQKAVVAIAKGMAASGEIILRKQSNDYV
ncbi:MAG: flagellar motor switch protein FliG [Sphingomonadaceae bacterium]|jgi:flagellar motor switch protein FliG